MAMRPRWTLWLPTLSLTNIELPCTNEVAYGPHTGASPFVRLYRQAGFLTLHLWVITSNSQAASSFNSEGINITNNTMHDPVPGAYASHARHNNELFLGAFFFSPTTGYIVFITIYYNGSLAWVLVLFVSPPKNMLEKKMLEQWKT
ncbi:hypothetical protein F5146DRAFT_1006862 [Armillaria mellea]|nr:hypothetical protein F5146DRAFT_1006862 [Armillaria mellea]